MSSSPLLHPAFGRRLPALLLLFGLAACQSDRPPPPGPPSGTAESVTPEMETQGTFLAGQIQVETLLNRGGFSGRAGQVPKADSGPTANTGQRGGGRGGMGRGRGGSSPTSDGRGPDGNREEAPGMHASNLAAVRLHLRLTNLGDVPVEVEVSDFDSELGNFVVQPAKILLPPHESVEAEPMTSRLGVTSDAIPVTISLRTANQSEKKVLILRPVKPPAPDAASSPST